MPTALRGLLADAPPAPAAEHPGPARDDWLVAALAADRALARSGVLGPFVVEDRTLGALERAVLAARGRGVPDLAEPLPVGVVVTGGAGAVAPVVRLAAQGPLTLEVLHLTLRDPGDPAAAARRVVAAVEDALDRGDLDEEVRVHVAVPTVGVPAAGLPASGWSAALDVLAAADLALTLDADDDAPALAASMAAALDRELAFDVVGRSPRAVPGPAGRGFLAPLLATRASLDGADPGEVAGVLGATDPAQVLQRLGGPGVEGARRWCTSYASPDVTASVADLRELGLVG